VVRGEVAPGFEAVRDAFAHNFEVGREVGAGLCVHVSGRKVVDLCGGRFDHGDGVEGGGREYGPDALQVVFSSTKGATAACASLLAQRGELDLDAPVTTYWPEFGAAGKESVPVRWLLSHQAGVPVLDRDLTPEQVWAWDPVIDALSEQQPVWQPGTAHGYHALTYGYLVGEVVRRISGRSLGTFFHDEVAGPLGLEFYIGLPQGRGLMERVSPIVGATFGPPTAEGGSGEGAAGGGQAAVSGYSKTLLARALNMGRAFRDLDWMNQPDWLAAEVPGGNGVTNAVSLSRMYAGLIGTVEGGPAEPLLTADQVEKARTVLTFGADQVFASVGMPLEQKIGLGFWRSSPEAPWGGEGSFGHGGAGGSYGFADPEHELAVGYVMNKMSAAVMGDPRARRIVRAVYQCLGTEAKYS
jgi:CubicO group peptidase (beta-lactamase class C family)